ncbi:MAG: hypothetical protein PHQ59_01115 [Candidatus Daviesbacteria bacterium]|nr:hypothetical protein [Candidatus Daviesbacteria bacterium]
MSGKYFLYIVIATFITALIWLTTEVIHSQRKNQISPEVQSLTEPINPNFDIKVINDL